MRSYTPSQLSTTDRQPAANKLIKDASKWDIIVGRPFVSHPGNLLLRKTIQPNRDYYHGLDTDMRKQATDAMIGE